MKTQAKSIKVGIVGINGKYGQWLKWFFEQLGYDVIGSDVGTEVTNRQVVDRVDVVVFSVPIDQVVGVISEVADLSREDQLFMDVTSIKSPAVEAMKKSKANLAPLHPMCAPPKLGQTLRGQVIVRCHIEDRLAPAWGAWVEEMLHATEARIKVSTPEAHDRSMAVVQGLTHAVALIMGGVIREMGVDVTDIQEYVSPPYKVSLSVIGRILSQNLALYRDIQMNNPFIEDVLRNLESEARHFRAVVESKNKSQFEADFIASREYLGDEVKKSNELFVEVAQFIATYPNKSGL